MPEKRKYLKIPNLLLYVCVACNATLLSLNENVKKCIHENANKCNLPIKRLSEAINERQLLGKERQFAFCFFKDEAHEMLPIVQYIWSFAHTCTDDTK